MADVDIFDDAAVATLRSDGGGVAMVVTNWGERLDPWWRLAVVEAGRRGASWCLLFNGTHLRLVNAVRVFSRRFVEFDLDCAADDDRTFCAMRMLMTADALTPSRRFTTPTWTFWSACRNVTPRTCAGRCEMVSSKPPSTCCGR